MKTNRKQSKEKKEKELFSKEDFESIKEFVEDKTIIENQDSLLKEINNSISSGEIELAKKVVQCYDILDTNSFKFKDQDKDLSKKINDFLKRFDVNELRRLNIEYGNGNDYGSHIIGENIKRNVNSNRNNYMELIKFFLMIFSEDD